MNCGIYSIRNILNNKVYIGQSVNLRKRKTRHFSELRNHRHPNPHLQRAFNKYGEDAFLFSIIIYCNKEDLTYYEDFFIKYYNSKYAGYNINDANAPPDNNGRKNGMYGKEPSNKRTDIDKQINEIAEKYKNGKPLSYLANEYHIHRKTLRKKLRTIFTKEEMSIINKNNHKNIKNKSANKGTIHNIQSRMNMSKSNNTSGYFRVSFDKYGGYWIYKYYDDKQKRRKLSAKNLDDLEDKVRNKGLVWKKF